jgi:uncharacterized protein (DUF2141 family)
MSTIRKQMITDGNQMIPRMKASADSSDRAGADLTFRFVVSRGRWAVSAFEDVNGNGVLDQGMFGPKEPTGFWRPFSAWRKPKFDDVAAQVVADIADANMDLK